MQRPWIQRALLLEKLGGAPSPCCVCGNPTPSEEFPRGVDLGRDAGNERQLICGVCALKYWYEDLVPDREVDVYEMLDFCCLKADFFEDRLIVHDLSDVSSHYKTPVEHWHDQVMEILRNRPAGQHVAVISPIPRRDVIAIWCAATLSLDGETNLWFCHGRHADTRAFVLGFRWASYLVSHRTKRYNLTAEATKMDDRYRFHQRFKIRVIADNRRETARIIHYGDSRSLRYAMSGAALSLMHRWRAEVTLDGMKVLTLFKPVKASELLQEMQQIIRT